MRWKVREKVDIFDWHPWFAWYPVCTEKKASGVSTRVWLELVMRRMQMRLSGDLETQYILPEDYSEEVK